MLNTSTLRAYNHAWQATICMVQQNMVLFSTHRMLETNYDFNEVRYWNT